MSGHDFLVQPLGVPTHPATSLTYSATVATASGRYQQHLTTTQVGTTVYLERGWVE